MNDSESQETNQISAPAVLTVAALNHAVSRMLERSFPLSWVTGEISNFTRAASGHWYFTLKDAQAQVRAVMFRGRAQYADFMPRDGDKVDVRALVTLYAPRGDYQLSVESIRRAGVGNLYEAFLRLKQALASEGLFDSDRKRPVPAMVRTVGIVTSPHAAALRDILAALRRRAPHVAIVIYPTPVQGEGAHKKIASAIDLANARQECEVLLVCRGGGSIEDLWSFNEEVVARAIVRCTMPVISGVGHETDFTIADFAADLRAPTPTAAAELAVRPRDDLLRALQNQARHLSAALQRSLSEKAQTLDWLGRRLQSPGSYIAHERTKMRALQVRLRHALRTPLAQSRFMLMQRNSRLNACLPNTDAHRKSNTEVSRRLTACMLAQVKDRRQRLDGLAAQLEMLNPQRTLERGYAIVSDQQGNILRDAARLKPRTSVNVRLAKGSAEIGIASVQPALD